MFAGIVYPNPFENDPILFSPCCAPVLCGLGCGAFYAVCLLAATLLIGACTPAMEIYRGICHIAKEGTFCLENEEPYTLADRPVSLNFETQNCENKLFFTYFAK